MQMQDGVGGQFLTGQQQQQLARQQHAQNLQMANDAAAAQQASQIHEQQHHQMMASLSGGGGDMAKSMGPPQQQQNEHGSSGPISRPGSSASSHYLLPHGPGSAAGPSSQGQPQPLPGRSPAGMSISLPPPHAMPIQVPASDMTPGGTSRPFAGAPQQPPPSSNADVQVRSSGAFATTVPSSNLAGEGGNTTASSNGNATSNTVNATSAAAANDDFGDFDFSGFDEFVDFNEVGSL